MVKFKNVTPLPPATINALKGGLGPPEPFLLPWWKFDGLSLTQVSTAAVNSWVCELSHVEKTLFPALCYCAGLLRTQSREFPRGLQVVWYIRPTEGHLFSAFESVGSPCLNLCTAKRTFSIKDWLKAAPFYRYKCKYLGESLILCPLSKIIIVGSPLWPMISLGICSWPGLQYQAWISSCGVGLKSNQKAFDYPQIFMTLFCQWAYLVSQWIFVVRSNHSWVRFW